ncbi:hypothetical protein MJD09_27015, partial [bacterium]|nr:hypothetical protein [bacterium]
MSLLKGNRPEWQHAWQNIRRVFREHSFWRYAPQMLMALVMIMSTALMFPHQKSYQFSHLAVGDVYMGDEIIAPFTFHIDKSKEQYDDDKRRAAEEVPLVFIRSDSVQQRALRKFSELIDAVEALKTVIAPDSIKNRQLQDILNRHSIIIEQQYVPLLLNRKSTELGSRGIKAKLPTDSAKQGTSRSGFDFEALKSNLSRILVDVFTIGILDVDSDAGAPNLNKISVVANEQETIEDVSDFYPAKNIDRIILDDKLRQTYPDREVEVKIGYAIVTAIVEPNLIHDAKETAARVKEAVSKVPLAKGTVLADERIVDKHERIAPATLEKLNSLAKARAEKDLREGGLKLVLPYIGRILIIGLALSLSVIFLFISRRSTFDNVKQMTMIFIILMLIIAFTFVINEVGIAKYKYLIPISIASMLLTIFFDTRTAFMGTVTLSILIGALRGNDFDIMLIALFVGTISILSTRQIQARSWILKGILFISIT